MFSSAVLDLAIGLIFSFLSVSLAAGTVVEAIASITKWRARTLSKGIGQLLNDPQFRGIAAELYAHAAINPRGPGRNAPKKNPPAYIDRQLFANAIMDISGISEQFAAAVKRATDPNDARPALDQLHDAIAAKCKEIANPQLEALLTGIIDRSFGNIDRIRSDLATWFDSSMDRVSGVYKRWTQLIAFIAAFLLAGGLNIDSIKVAEALWIQPKLAEQLKLPPIPAPTAPAGNESGAASSSPKASSTGVLPDPLTTLQRLDQTLPVGWPDGFWRDDQGTALWQGYVPSPQFWMAAIGWLITALSAVFGAPFWFDLLQTFVRLKGSGPSPLEKVQGKGAAA
jgi:hypothetical protein